MPVTTTLKSGDGVARFATGTYITDVTAAAHDVNCGFQPKHVTVYNETSRDSIEWNDTMADAEGFKRVAAGTGTFITSLGITPLDNGTTKGFRIGLDTDINVTNEQVSWVARG